MQNSKNIVRFLLILALFSFGCKENTTEPKLENASILGKVLFLDGTIGAYAYLELQNTATNSRVYQSADANGNYQFNDLPSGNYFIRYKSSSYNINSVEKELNLAESENLEQNIYILFNMVDELTAVKKNNEVVLIKFQPDGAKIGDNFNAVNYLSGSYFGDYSHQSTLNCDVYFCPDSLDWFSSDSIFTPDYIKQNFEFVTSLEEVFSNGIHEIRVYDNDISQILSNPTNGFALIKNKIDETELQIPCVDYNNNDFGLKINYKQ